MKNIVFADPLVQKLCAEQWGTNGNVSVRDLENITEIGMVYDGDPYHNSVLIFNENISIHRPHIRSFKELKYFRNLKKIGRYCFIGCDELEAVTIPDSVESIGKYAFAFNGKLREVHIPDATKEIDSRAFSNCTSLQKISMPSGIRLGIGVFDFCRPDLEIEYRPGGHFSLKNEILFEDAVVQKIVINAWGHEGKFTYEDAAAVKAIGDMPGLSDWRDENNALIFDEIEMDQRPQITSFNELRFFTNLKAIGGFAFCQCEHLKSIMIPDGVEFIGDYAFAYCFCLEKIKIPSTVKRIGRRAFVNCKELREVRIPRHIEIGREAFGNCAENIRMIYE